VTGRSHFACWASTITTGVFQHHHLNWIAVYLQSCDASIVQYSMQPHHSSRESSMSSPQVGSQNAMAGNSIGTRQERPCHLQMLLLFTM
jgi:hypothetical protein